MNKRFCSVALVLQGLVLMAVLDTALKAAELESGAIKEAALRVAEALEAELQGDFLSRQRLLAEAESLVPDFAPACWQQGKVRNTAGEWLGIEESIELSADSPRLLSYERRRAGLPDDLASHLSIAAWCSTQGLVDQSRAHWSRALMFDSDQPRARAALGYQLVGTEWISPEQIAELGMRTQRASESLTAYRSQLQTIVAALGDPQLHSAAVAALMEIKDPAAVPAVEAVLTSPNLNLLRLTIEWLEGIDSLEASQVIARFSLFHPADEVRAYATSKLKQRPLHDFVPEMLNMLSAPVSAMIVPEFDRSGYLTGYRQAFAQEKFDKIDLLVLDRQFIRNSPPGVFSFAQLQQSQFVDATVRETATTEVAARNAALVRENRQIAERNARVGLVLSEIAEREFSGNPKALWDWWDEQNTTKYQDYKPQRYRRNSLAEQVTDFSEPRRQVGECFVAGTQVTTFRGRRAIEQVVAGDLVLSRNVQSGELAWKPVLRATTRPAETIQVVSLGDEELHCTAGHLFWVSGRAWLKASELEAGDILHAAREPSVVTKVGATSPAPTFNLQVADFANYFVGKNLVLTHDVTPRGSTRRLVPGLRLAHEE